MPTYKIFFFKVKFSPKKKFIMHLFIQEVKKITFF
jgi:hypothetical protein